MPSLKSIEEQATVQVGRRKYSQEHFARIRSISNGATFEPASAAEPTEPAPNKNASRDAPPENEGAAKRSNVLDTQPAAVVPNPIKAGIVSKKYNASAGETTIELIVPQGKLGIDIQSVLTGNNTKVCKVVNKNNPTSLLEVGDIIVSLNDINLSNIKVSLNLGVWTTLFRTEATKGPMKLVVRRPDNTAMPAVQELNKSEKVASISSNTVPSQITIPTTSSAPKAEKTSGLKRKSDTFSFACNTEIKALEDRLKSAKKFEKLAREEVKAAEASLKAAKKKWEEDVSGGKKRAVSPTDGMEVLV